MSRLANFFRGTVVYAIGSAINKGLGILSNVLLATLLGATVYGQISVLWGAFSILSTFSVMGIPEGLARNLAYDEADGRDETKSLVYSGCLLILPLNVALAVLTVWNAGVVVNVLNVSLPKLYLGLFALLFPLNVVTQISNAILRAFEQPGKKALADFTARVAGIVALVALLAVTTRNAAGTFYYVAFLLVNAAAASFFAYNWIPAGSLRNVGTRAKELFRFSWPLTFQGAFLTLMMYADVIVVGYFLGPTQSGIYRAAWVLAQVPLFGLQVVQFLYTPMQSEQFANDQSDRMELTYQAVTKWILILTFPVLFTLVVFSGTILRLVYQPEFVSGSIVLVLLSLAAAVQLLSGPDDLTLTAMGETRVLFFTSALAAMGNVVLNVVLVSEYGIVGGAVATLGSFVLLHGGQVGYLSVTYDLIPLGRRTLLSLASLCALSSLVPLLAPVAGVYRFVISLLAVVAVTIVVAVGIAMTSEEHQTIVELLPVSPWK